MTRILIDHALRHQLHEFSERLEFCDESGQVVAQVIPLAELRAAQPELPREELARRKSSSEWFTTEQVLAHLENS